MSLNKSTILPVTALAVLGFLGLHRAVAKSIKITHLQKISAVSAQATTVVNPPAPFGPLPSPAQLAWQQRELIAFVHFNMNTFTDAEWGQGNEDPNLFNPTQLDCNQWIRALKAGGFQQAILTAKHHDGFCIWPSAYTDHSVKSSSWRAGKGDVVREFIDACHAQGMTPGLYLSPWDRNSPYYGQGQAYNTYYENQMTELMRYGDLGEWWMDGANGEGPNGKVQQYDWDAYAKIIHQFEPNAVIFGNGAADTTNDIRWVGNEAGLAPTTVWNWGGDGASRYWLPTETDTSIRPGWYYHASQDSQIKSLPTLLKLYYASVGHGTVFLLNVPPDRRGLFTDADVARLQEFGQAIKTIFAHDLAAGMPVTATNTRGGSAQFAPANTVGSNPGTYWAADDGVTTASLEVNLGSPTAFNNVVLQEYIPLGQRIDAINIEGYIDSTWRKIATATTVGYKRLFWFPTVTASKLRVNITRAEACPTLSRIGIFRGPYEAPVTPVSVLSGKPATASDVHLNQTEFGADKAVDDDPSTRWATNDSVKACWLQVDAGQPVQIARVSISEFAPRISKFQLEYKLNVGDPWSVALAGTTVGTDYNATFPPVTARFVRLNILDATAAPTIYEFQVYSPISLLTGRSVTASNVYQSNQAYNANKAVDDNPVTRWATDDGTVECWLQGDMGSAKTVSHVYISEFEPRIRKFQLEYKLNSTDPWSVALVGTTVGTDYSQSFTPVQARSVRLHILDASYAPTIYEFQVTAP